MSAWYFKLGMSKTTFLICSAYPQIKHSNENKIHPSPSCYGSSPQTPFPHLAAYLKLSDILIISFFVDALLSANQKKKKHPRGSVFTITLNPIFFSIVVTTHNSDSNCVQLHSSKVLLTCPLPSSRSLSLWQHS